MSIRGGSRIIALRVMAFLAIVVQPAPAQRPARVSVAGEVLWIAAHTMLVDAWRAGNAWRVTPSRQA